ncbi:hypothetical protein [Stutzerimonas stutzeri]|uniref:hypothetical protein n=1 Tax=Stutzerimonas stutzeri TaxID=316 RepID=UPI0039BC7DA7
MIDTSEKKTLALDLDEQPTKRKRGRPATGAAMTAAEKQRAYRERVKSKQGGSMSDRWIHMFFADVVRLRIEQDSLSRMGYYGRCSGAIYALYQAEAISTEIYYRLDGLVQSAMIDSGRPFVDGRNAGPVIPRYIALQREHEDA